MMDGEKDEAVDLAAYVDTVAGFVGLPVPEASRPLVIANLEIAQRMFAHIAAFDMDEREEPAPVYRPGAGA